MFSLLSCSLGGCLRLNWGEGGRERKGEREGGRGRERDGHRRIEESYLSNSVTISQVPPSTCGTVDFRERFA